MNFSDLSKAQRALLVQIYQAERAASIDDAADSSIARISSERAAPIGATWLRGKSRQTAGNLADKGFLEAVQRRWDGLPYQVRLTVDGRRATRLALSSSGQRARAIRPR